MAPLSTNRMQSVLRTASGILTRPISIEAAGGMVGLFLAELVRRSSHRIVQAIDDALRITAIINDTDPSFDWPLHFIRTTLGSSSLSPQSNTLSADVPIYKEVLEILNRRGRIPPNRFKILTQKPTSSPDDMQDDEEDDLPSDPRKANDQVPVYRYPIDALDVVINFEGYDYRFRMVNLHGDGSPGKGLEISVIPINRSRDIFLPLIYHSRTLISHIRNHLSKTCKPLRSWESIFLPPSIKDKILRDTRDFLDGKAFYRKRGLPWRRGWLLYGLHGTGKTSLITALASHFSLQIYVINLGARGIDDDELLKLVMSIPPKSILLFEDIDCAFQATKNTELFQDRDTILKGDEHSIADPSHSSPLHDSSLSLDDNIGVTHKAKAGYQAIKEDHPTPFPSCDTPQMVIPSELTLEQENSIIPKCDQSVPREAEVESPKRPNEDMATPPKKVDNPHESSNNGPSIPFPSRFINPLDFPASPSRITLSDGLAASEGRVLFCTTNWKDRIDPALYRPGLCDVWLEFTYVTPKQAHDLFKFFYQPDSAEALPSPNGVTPGSAMDDIDGLLETAPKKGVLTDNNTEKVEQEILEDIDKLAQEFPLLFPKDRLTISSLQSYLMHFKNQPEKAIEYFPTWVEDGCKYTFMEEG
ncbi:uncharacterized protein L199_006809 [Kwoniella botswanensis]|uniref:uncharacterized protein n=1 Tax=Kwoniella botswanensis TaxID=1268659 RepID=UPI00315DAF24